ncbi:MAG: ester cyclase [Rhodanobacteraceae bacterium]|nr:ester cyclase [Rhodanobacteraceae bacterium]
MSNASISALKRAREFWNGGDLEAYLRLYSDAVILHGYADVAPGMDGVRAFYQRFWAAFPGSKLVFHEVAAAGDDQVMCRFEVQGTHAGPFQGFPASGRSFVLPGITILRFAGDRCVERWSQADFLGLFVQLGMLPAA